MREINAAIAEEENDFPDSDDEPLYVRKLEIIALRNMRRNREAEEELKEGRRIRQKIIDEAKLEAAKIIEDERECRKIIDRAMEPAPLRPM